MADAGVEKEYVGVIWIGESPGIRLSVMARSADEAHAKVVAEYGEGHVMTLRNEPVHRCLALDIHRCVPHYALRDETPDRPIARQGRPRRAHPYNAAG